MICGPAQLLNLFFCCAEIEGISNKLKVDVTKGLAGKDFPERTSFFGNNYRAPIEAKTFCKIFFEALDDFMLKVLIVAATGSLIFEYIGADPDHYSTGKCRCQQGLQASSLIIQGHVSPDPAYFKLRLLLE